MYISINYMYYILIVIMLVISVYSDDYVSDICIFRLGVYEVYCVILLYILFVYFFVGSGVGGLCT